MTLAPFRVLLLRVLFTLALTTTAASRADTPELRDFTTRSFAEIRAAHAHHAVVITFWSVNCEPCHREMALLARLHRRYPAVQLVLVAADAPELRPVVLRQLGRHELGDIEAWQFSAEPEERLRYSVDHTWRGELPRACFIDAGGQVVARTGIPNESWVTDWFVRASKADATHAVESNQPTDP